MDEFYLAAAKAKCLSSHLFFTRYFFKQRQGSKFLLNWHHHYMAAELEKVITGETENLVINMPPGGSKTEVAVVNFIARGLALNPRARFMHLSYSDDLTSLNSQNAKEIVMSDEYQALFPTLIAADTKAKKRWNVMVDSKKAGGVYATSMAGQVTGFRAGHMAEGFQGAIIIDDPVKPDDMFSKVRMEGTNRKLMTTVKSRRAKPLTPTVLIMQRVSDNDPTAYVLSGAIGGKWKHIQIPALIDDDYVAGLPEPIQEMVNSSVRDERGRFSYWEFKEPLHELLAMESGSGTDSQGNQISRHVFNSQYQQRPTALGGNIFKGSQFVRYKKLPMLRYRKIYADTAQKTKEWNDRSVFECWGHGVDGRIYLIDILKGKWEAPELRARARAFWAKHKGADWERENLGVLREMKVEDKVSGTDLIQTLKLGDREHDPIPIKEISRSADKTKPRAAQDKLTRAMNGLPYIEAGMVCVPEEAEFTNDFIGEHEAFTPDDSHRYDDQVDACMDAIDDMLSTGNKLNTWAALGKQVKK